jgi:hypothetical protein
VSATVSRRRAARRRLIVAVVLIDLIGIAALAIALTHHSSHPTSSSASAAASVQPLARPQAPQTLIGDPHAATPTAVGQPAYRHRRRPHPARAQPAAAGPSTSGAQASFGRLASGLPGSAGLAIAPIGGGDTLTFGSLQVGHAWSTMKVPLLATLLAQLEARGGQLDSAERNDAAAAVEASNNSAAEALFAVLERSNGGLLGASQAVQQTLRRAGDGQTVINTAPNNSGFTTWGQSEWSTSGEVAFYRALARGCLLSGADTAHVLSLMVQVESDQRWGAGSAGFPNVAFKGGWGPENGAGYLVRQTAIASAGSRGYVLSMIAKPSDGSFPTGTHMLNEIASWAARTFPPASAPSGGSGCP